MVTTMIQISVDDITQLDHLDRPLIHYAVAKKAGIRKGTVFATDCGNLEAVEYIDWNPRTNRGFSGFACREVG